MSHTDPQDDIPCTACETEGSRSRLDDEGLCPDCRTEENKLLAALRSRGVKVHNEPGEYTFIGGEDGLFLLFDEPGDNIDNEPLYQVTLAAPAFWRFTSDEMGAAADAIAAIVQAPDLRKRLGSATLRLEAAEASIEVWVKETPTIADFRRVIMGDAAGSLVDAALALVAERDTLAARVTALEEHNARMAAQIIRIANVCHVDRIQLPGVVMNFGETVSDALRRIADGGAS